ncbi:MAG: ABC transporter permease [Candidatus Riflebacteria bacterium RBG_13_59_9]|nr:MAG: ABC transporter permease [Candidatus Riflebacteria bacterium RBG_13_59_9]
MAIGTRQQRNTLAAWLFISVPLLLFLTFYFAPMGVALVTSLHKWNLLSPMRFVGLRNYVALFKAPDFWNALRVTIVYVVGIVPTALVISIVVAILLNERILGLPFFRIMVYLPAITPMAAAALIFVHLLEPDFGLINYVLSFFGIPKLRWLNDPGLALLAVMMVGVWKDIGYNAIIVLAGLQSIPGVYYDAARIDGANRVQIVGRITLPLLSPVIFFIAVVQVIASLQVFTSIKVMTSGGPAGATESIPYYLYNNAFRYSNMGYASAVALVLFVIIFVFTMLQFRFGERKVHY